MPNTKVTINLSGKWKLHIELAGRPVDFEIEFPSGKTVNFTRAAGPVATVEEVTVPGAGVLDQSVDLPPTGIYPAGRTKKHKKFKDAAGDSIEYISDPGM